MNEGDWLRFEILVARSENPVDEYAKLVVARGSEIAGKYHLLACRRHLADRDREADPSFPYYFSLEHAQRFWRFCGKLKHYKGEWAGKFVQLSAFQLFRLGCMFGWRERGTNLRRFTTAYNELTRKHGKSLEAAAVGLYATFFEGEPGAEGYCIATKEKQALDIVFLNMKQMIAASPGLKKRLIVLKKNIHDPRTTSKIEPLGSDSETQDGLNPHSVTTDELHAFKGRGLIDVLETAMGARRNPMHNQITTAGETLVSVCGDQHIYATRILEGHLDDDPSAERFFACIAHADDTDDPWVEETWRKANPHWGISVNPEYVRSMAAKAIQIPSAQQTFKQKILNLWVNASKASLSVPGWHAAQTKNFPKADFEVLLRGQRCYVGIDLASSIDLCSLSCLFPPNGARRQWKLVQRIWTPEETMKERAKRDRAPYDIWAQQGWLIAAPGKRVDHGLVKEACLWARRTYDVQMFGFDPWHAEQLATDLQNHHGVPEERLVAISQTFAGMSAAETEFKALVLGSEIDANSCPVTSWAVENVAEDIDGKGNIMFSKKKSRARIDPVKSATIAMACWKRQEPEEKEYQVIVIGGNKR